MSVLNLKASVEKAVAEKNWYAALALALALPDICGKLESPAISSQKRYVAWFDKYLLRTYTVNMSGKTIVFLNGNDLYALRCSLLHEGSEDISEQRARQILDKFIFSIEESHRIMIDDSILILNVAKFCQEICESVDEWFNDVKNDSDIMDRINAMLIIRGLSYSPAYGIGIGKRL